MNNKPLNICILAAGKGTRMNSSLPKVLHKINNKPIIHFVIEKSMALNPDKIILIVGYKKTLVKESVKNFDIDFAYQEEQKGTAHAIEQCIPQIKKLKGNTLVLSGDVPLISIETLDKLISIHSKNNSIASILTADINDPSGYGRIIRSNTNDFLKIIEHKDATPDQLKINEINSGIYLFNTDTLCQKIFLIKNNNMQNEYYLTDIFNHVNTANVSIHKTDNIDEINGVNTIEQLENLEETIINEQ